MANGPTRTETRISMSSRLTEKSLSVELRNTKGTSPDELWFTSRYPNLRKPVKFDISAFTDLGTLRTDNQDRILINGRLSGEGHIDLTNQLSSVCFVADGVGGNKHGEFASEFVLRGITSIRTLEDIEEQLRAINADLVRISAANPELRGASTTLSGLIATNDYFRIVHVGDSQIWLRRNGTLFKITTDHVLTEYESNSPLTSFFGGSDADLKFDSENAVDEFAVGDLFLICSDGLLKSLNHKTIKATVEGQVDLLFKARTLLEECRQNGAEDNVSVILVERTE